MNQEEMRRATAREWLAAKIVFAAGFVIAIAVAAWFVWHPSQPQQPAPEAVLLPPPETTVPSPVPHETQAEADAKDAMLVCAQELVNAKNSGIVPAYSQLATLTPRNTDVKGRFACEAATPAAHYVINADLVCRTITDARCVRIHDITTPDGTVLYQRQG